jgi:osmotically-inducible protein OsmY
MVLRKRISLLCLTALLAVAFGCSSSPTKEGTGEYVDDAAVTAKVKAEILQAPSLKSSEIKVETFKGVVQLSGFVGSQAEVSTAAEVARTVKGVTEVRNDVKIKSASNSTQEGAGEFVDNAAITAKVKAELFKDSSLKSAEISVETFKGVVQLSGFVGYQSEADTAAKLAAKVEGVKSVKNDIRIKGKQ